jgi:hypothetical protein
MKKILLNHEGNATIMWVAALPAFIVLLLVVGNLGAVWVAHSSAQLAADAGSIAATKKMDEWLAPQVDQELHGLPGKATNEIENMPIEDKMKVLSEKKPELFSRLVEEILRTREKEMADSVRYYVKKNGGYEHGKIIFPVNDRIQVEAKAKYKPLIWDEMFKGIYAKGTGAGPSRPAYFKLLKESSVVIEY